MKWVFVGVFGAITGFSNLNKISPIVKKNCLILNESGKLYYIILGLLAVVHLSFTVVVKISFSLKDSEIYIELTFLYKEQKMVIIVYTSSKLKYFVDVSQVNFFNHYNSHAMVTKKN